MGDTQQLALQMQHAEARGDLRSARALAGEILAAPQDGDAAEPEAQAESGARASDVDPVARMPEGALGPAARLSAAQLLARTQPDAFLLVVGLLGLGVMVWLVYNYIL